MTSTFVNRVGVGLAACAVALSALAQSTPDKAAKAPASQSPKKAGPAVVRRAPPPPPAALPLPILTRVQAGCLDEATFKGLSLSLEGSLPGLERVMAPAPEWGPPAPCPPFSAVFTSEVSTLLVLQPAQGGNPPDALVLTREPGRDLILARQEALTPMELVLREVRLAARGLDAQPIDARAAVPAHLQWELEHLLRALVSPVVSGDGHHVRLLLESPGLGAPERIAALELIETDASRLVDAVVWHARAELPGAYIGLSGFDYERVLWQWPVKHERISRGVGPSSATVNRRVTRPANDGGKPEVVNRSVRYIGQHIGIDYVAPRGTPVNAVADSTVVFVGTKPGYGRMVILDHGEGYQTYYAHLTAFTKGLKAGMKLARGEVLGQVGSTGISTGPHLHYEIRKHGDYIDVFDEGSRLSFWNLAYEEHPAFLARLMALTPARAVATGEPGPAVFAARRSGES